MIFPGFISILSGLLIILAWKYARSDLIRWASVLTIISIAIGISLYTLEIYNVIAILIFLVTWKYIVSWAIRIMIGFILITACISTHIIINDRIQYNNFQQLQQFVNDPTTPPKLVNSDELLYKILLKSANMRKVQKTIQKENSVKENDSDILDMEEVIGPNHKQYESFKLYNELLRILYTKHQCDLNNIEKSFHVKANLHGFSSDIAYLAVIDKMLESNQKQQAIELIIQLLNHQRNVLSSKTHDILKALLITLIK